MKNLDVKHLVPPLKFKFKHVYLIDCEFFETIRKKKKKNIIKEYKMSYVLSLKYKKCSRIIKMLLYVARIKDN